MTDSVASKYNWPYIAGYLLVWGAVFAGLSNTGNFDIAEAAGVFVLLAILLPGLSLFFTRRVEPLANRVKSPRQESLFLLAYLLFIAYVLVEGFGAVSRITAEPEHSLVLAGLKIAVFILIPASLLLYFGRYRFRELFSFSLRGRDLIPAFWISFAGLAIQAVLGRGVHDIRESGIPGYALLAGVPLSLLFLLLETGLVEEFFFRTLLQERLASALHSPWGGIVIAAALFGMVHAPGFYLRTSATQESLGLHPSLLFAAGYSIVITSLAGLFLGVLWMRTKNLAVVALVHAAMDLIPNLVPFCRNFHLL